MDEIEHDVLLMVGGEFSPIALTPEGYETVLSRARSRASEYLDVFERLFLGARFDAQLQSRLHLPAFLSLLKEAAPERVSALANQLMTQYGAILVVYDQISDKNALDDLLPLESANFLVRLNDRREQLRRLTTES